MNRVNIIDDAMASERFLPDIGEQYKRSYEAMVIQISNSLPLNRTEIIKNEIARISRLIEDNEDLKNDLDTLKYLATLQVLIDLSKQGWIFQVQDGVLTLKMENDNVDDKAHIRYRLSAERNAQFKSKSVQTFIKTLETPKEYNGKHISVKNLIGDANYLQEAIKNGQQICAPYVQLVSNSRDEKTGYRLSDIWRYFRYTWSIPYRTMPGRNLFYLVRDGLQTYHPVIGIFALGNSVLNLTVRDDDIGWTVDAIKKELERKNRVAYCQQTLSKTGGNTVKVKISTPIETDFEYQQRIEDYSNQIYPLLFKNINTAIDEIYVKDLGYHRQTKYPKQEYIDSLLAMSEKLRKLAINNKNNEVNPNWEEETHSTLFKRKRASELAKLLTAKRAFQLTTGENNHERLLNIMSSEAGRKAVNTALIANRKCKIGSNMMEIIVCGSIPPYNDLLGGKLVSILACSPIVIRDYTRRYEKQISEIASRMKGKKVIRDSRLAFLGTTSLYSIGSSQYNRIKVPLENGRFLKYRKVGITEGYGTVYFSTETTTLFSRILEIKDGGKRINHVFGEGTSPRFRMISRGLSTIGIHADAFLRHYSPRIVYSIDLASNTKKFLMGLTDNLDYAFDINNDEQIFAKTDELIQYWYKRWLLKRLTTVDIIERLSRFNVDNFLLSNLF